MSAPEAFELSIILPCLNEAETLAGCIREAQEALRANRIAGELIVADNGSSDGSGALAESLGARVVQVRERGYGSALRGGIGAARGRYLLMGDADGSYDFGEAPKFLAALRAGSELVMGNRFAGGIAPGAMPWKNRYLGNPLLSGLGRLLFRSPVRDFHCGLRACSRDAYERLELRTEGMEFATEMVLKATLLGQRIDEVPIALRRDGRSRAPHLRPWRDGWRHLRFMLLFSPRWLFLYPGLALMAVGALLGGRLVKGPLELGRVELDVHTLLFCALALLVGFQSTLFALLSSVFVARFGLGLPPSGAARALSSFGLERGLLIGLLLSLAGLLLSLWATLHWRAGGFGPLDPARVLRIVIPGATLLALGCQVMLGSFLLGIFELKLSRT